MTATFRRRDLQYDHDLPDQRHRVSCNHEVSNADDFYAISATSETLHGRPLSVQVSCQVAAKT